MILIFCAIILSILPFFLLLTRINNFIFLFSLISYTYFLSNQYLSYYLPILLDINQGIYLNEISTLAILHHVILYILFIITLVKFAKTNNNIPLDISNYNNYNKCFVAAFLTAFIIFSVYKISNFTFTPRKDYLFGRYNNGYIYIFQVYIISLTAFITAFIKISKKIRMLLILFVLLDAYLIGSKGVFIQIIIFYAAIFFIYNNKSNYINKFNYILIIILILLVTLLILFRDQSKISDITGYLNQPFETQKVIAEAIKTDKLVLIDLEVFISEKWSYFPRIFFPEKPIFYSTALPYAIIYPEIIGNSLATPGAGEITYKYFDFKYITPIVIFIDKIIDYRFIFGIIIYILLKNKIPKKILYLYTIFYMSLPNFGVHLPIIYSFLIYYLFLRFMFYQSRDN